MKKRPFGITKISNPKDYTLQNFWTKALTSKLDKETIDNTTNFNELKSVGCNKYRKFASAMETAIHEVGHGIIIPSHLSYLEVKGIRWGLMTYKSPFDLNVECQISLAGRVAERRFLGKSLRKLSDWPQNRRGESDMLSAMRVGYFNLNLLTLREFEAKANTVWLPNINRIMDSNWDFMLRMAKLLVEKRYISGWKFNEECENR